MEGSRTCKIPQKKLLNLNPNVEILLFSAPPSNLARPDA
jgi:hypothetical protein